MNMSGTRLEDQPVLEQLVQRAWARASVSLPVLVESEEGKHTAHIRDISAGGAMVETAACLHCGSQIVLCCGTIQASGLIVWEGPGRFGLQFCCPLDEAEINQQLVRSNAAAERRRSRVAAQPAKNQCPPKETALANRAEDE
jgi:hypothetical protein